MGPVARGFVILCVTRDYEPNSDVNDEWFGLKLWWDSFIKWSDANRLMYPPSRHRMLVWTIWRGGFSDTQYDLIYSICHNHHCPPKWQNLLHRLHTPIFYIHPILPHWLLSFCCSQVARVVFKLFKFWFLECSFLQVIILLYYIHFDWTSYFHCQKHNIH